jgi:insulysin
VESLIVKNLEKPQNLNQHAMMLWEEIAEQRYVFDRREREAEALKSITKQEVLDIFKQIVLDKESRKKVSIQVWAHKHKMPTELKNDAEKKIVYIDDFYSFKMNMPLFPLFLQK